MVHTQVTAYPRARAQPIGPTPREHTTRSVSYLTHRFGVSNKFKHLYGFYVIVTRIDEIYKVELPIQIKQLLERSRKVAGTARGWWWVRAESSSFPRLWELVVSWRRVAMACCRNAVRATNG